MSDQHQDPAPALLLGAGWLLARLPSALAFTGYMVLAV